MVDVSVPGEPVIVGAFDTPGNANDVKAVGTLAYIADGSAGLQIVDVSDPTAPVGVGAVDTPGDAHDPRYRAPSPMSPTGHPSEAARRD